MSKRNAAVTIGGVVFVFVAGWFLAGVWNELHRPHTMEEPPTLVWYTSKGEFPGMSERVIPDSCIVDSVRVLQNYTTYAVYGVDGGMLSEEVKRGNWFAAATLSRMGK